MLDCLYKIALDVSLYAVDKILESSTEAYTCSVLTAADNHEKTDNDAPKCTTFSANGTSHQSSAAGQPKPAGCSISVQKPSLYACSNRPCRRRIVKLRIKTSGVSNPKESIAAATSKHIMTTASISAVHMMSPPLSPTSLASAECIFHPEYISISSKQERFMSKSSKSSSKKRLSVRTFRKQFNMPTIFEESEVATKLAGEERRESDELIRKVNNSEAENKDVIEVDLNNNSAVERSRA